MNSFGEVAPIRAAVESSEADQPSSGDTAAPLPPVPPVTTLNAPAVTGQTYSAFSPYFQDAMPASPGIASLGPSPSQPPLSTGTRESTMDFDQESYRSFGAKSADRQSIVPPPPVTRPPSHAGTWDDDATVTLELPSTHNLPTPTPSSLEKKFPRNQRSCLVRYRLCWILLAVVVVLLLGLGAGAYFGMSTIAQSFMDGSQMKFQSVAITNPTADSFRVAVLGKISDAGPFSATTTPMNLTIYYEDMVLGSMEMPAIELTLGSADLNTTTTFHIADTDAFRNFSAAMVTQPTFVWRIVGETNLTAFGTVLQGLRLDKKIVLNGMNNLAGVQVTAFDLHGRENQPIETDITAQVVNRSPISIEIGTVDFDLVYGSGTIGRVRGRHLAVHSGVNNMTLDGVLAPSPNPNATNFSNLFSNYMSGKPSTVQCIGAGLHETNSSIPWLEYALKQMNMSVVLQPPANMDMITAIDFDGMAMDFSASNSSNITISAKNITVDFKLPFDFPVRILEVRQSFDVLDAEGNVIASASSSQFDKASNIGNSTRIDTSLSAGTMQVPSGQEVAFATFLQGLFAADVGILQLRGKADVLAHTGVGVVLLSGVPFSKQTSVEGMQKLNYIKPDGRTSNPIVRGYQITKGTPDEIILMTDITLFSASSVSMNMGDVKLELHTNGTRIGYALIRNLIVNPGDNEITCETHFAPRTPQERAVGDKMLSDAVQGIATPVVMTGNSTFSTQNPLLAIAVGDLHLEAPLPGLPSPLVVSSKLKVNPFTSAFTDRAETSFKINNYMNETFAFDAMNMTVSHRGMVLANLSVPRNTTTKVLVPARTEMQTQYFSVQMNDATSKESLKALAQALGGKLKVDVQGVISAYVGEYHFLTDYRQTNLTTHVTIF